jgi:hypothetical protein
MANYNSLKNAGILAPVANTDLGSPTNKYGNLYMSGNISLNGTSLNSTNAISPRVASISYVGDDTAANPAGGATITLTGSGFVGSSVYVGGTIAGSVSVVSSTQITFTAPAKTAGSYSLSVVNSDGATATFVPGMQYSGVPTWTTSAGSLGSVNTSTSVNFTVAATSDSAVAYSVTSGSLPSGVSLNSSTGAITGTAPSVSSTTTYNFTIRATDSENQDTDRNFSITISVIISIDYLIVAGGGGNDTGGATGGGGGGGYLTTIGGSQYAVSPGTLYNIVVGSGGATGSQGGNSTAFGLTAYGGGKGGGGGGGYLGGNGGSGGGGNINGGAGGKGVYPGSSYISGPRQGYDASQSSYWQGGGGAGGTTTTEYGGPGAANDITGTSYTYSVGGTGYVGASYSDPAPAGSGTYGAGSNGGKPAPGGAGNGIVVIRYADTIPAATSTTGSPAYTVTGGYRRYVFTSSGSITF